MLLWCFRGKAQSPIRSYQLSVMKGGDDKKYITLHYYCD